MSTSDALREFIDAINATGGVTKVKDGIVPVADLDWLDLGEAYASACQALQQDMMMEPCDCGRLPDECTFDPEDETSQHGDN